MDKATILLINADYEIKNTIESINQIDIAIVSYDKTIAFSKLIEHQLFDLVIVNIEHGNYDCFNNLSFLKNKYPKRIIPIIIITDQNNNFPQIIQHLSSFHIDILMKPFIKELLENKLKIFLEHLQLEADLQDKIDKLSDLNKKYKIAQDEIKSIAYYDYLTSIPNRRYMDLELSKQTRNCSRKGEPISVLMVDLDNFKGYNDYYGHIEGDKVLQQVAEIIKNCTQRPLDFAARYGGEEFVVILPNTDENGALRIAEQIRINTLNSRISHCPKCKFQFVTVSIGIYTTIPRHIEDIDKLISYSDQAMYQAKESGKNQTYIYKK